ncbi:hypothetical protein AOZ07_03070 [Glutamicibacter halophytocola]|uniref:hypothetical protein n=1 Tax=Glutamicibacter halophytocola TaxID=1933880 RepID=UPI0006D497C7|nr:hypothetical protein [Glutamicibacter halophytocola]ALG28080.1 hypothetical protein AOZ07_03070 [Glutamicibacter halophytocola]
MAEPFASLEDLVKHWPDLPEELREVAETKLAEASTIIRGLYPGIDGRISSGKLDTDVVKLVVCQMVATALKREVDASDGDDVSQQTFTAGPFSQSLSFRAREASLFLTKLHRQLLGGGNRNRKAFMIIPGR